MQKRAVVTSTSAVLIVWALNATPLIAQVQPEPTQAPPPSTPELDEGGLGLPGGFVLTPSLGLFGFFDDNVFLTREAPQESGGARFTGGLGLSKSGRRLSFNASYSFAADVFAQFPEIDDLLAEQFASVGFRYQAGRRTSAFISAGYSMSRRPGDLIPDTDLTFLRAAAETYSSGVGVTRQIGADAQLGFSYRYSVLVSARRVVEERPSESWSVRLSKKVGRRTTAGATGGVRNIDGTFRATYSFSLAHRRRRSSLSLGYSRGTYLIPTAEGSTESESLGAGISLQAGRLSLGLSPRVSQSADSRRLVRTFSVRASASLSLGRWVSLEASYRGSTQRREPRDRTSELIRNIFFFGVTFSRPIRLQ